MGEPYHALTAVGQVGLQYDRRCRLAESHNGLCDNLIADWRGDRQQVVTTEWKMKKGLAAKLNARIQAIMQTEDWLGAIDLVQNHTETVQTHWELSWNLGWAYFKLDRFKEARKCLLTAARLAPQNPVCQWALGIVRRSLGNHKAAEVALKRALRIRDSYIARIALALTYMEEGKIDEAEHVHLEGLRLRPTGERYKAYANFLWDVGREDEAQRIYRKARRVRAKKNRPTDRS